MNKEMTVNGKSYTIIKLLSQEELAIKLNVVRQTVSKWENGLSVPVVCMINLNSILATYPEWGQKVPPLSPFWGEKHHQI